MKNVSNPKRKQLVRSNKPKRNELSVGGGSEEDSDDAQYQLNVIPKVNMRAPTPRRQLVHHQSLTFIADLAQTSTPTRTSAEPITSTPKQLTHDPLKYHPTQTIRSKKQIAVVTSSTKRSCKSSNHQKRDNHQCMQCVIVSSAATAAAKSAGGVCGIRHKRKRTDSISIVGHASEWNCNFCNLSRAVSSIGETAVAALGHLAVSSSTKKSRVKFVKTSNVEISLQDLLYAPTKSTKFDLVTTSRPRVVRKQHSKIYYL